MKKKILLLNLLLIPLSGIVYAQGDKLQLGIKAGINSANIYDKQAEDFTADPKIGFAGGVFLSIPIGTYLGIQPEVIYSEKGFEANGAISGMEYKYKRTTGFIDVPIQLQFKPFNFLTLLGGPQYSYMAYRKEKFESSFITTVDEEAIKNTNLRKNIMGIVLGLDLNIKSFVIAPRVGWDLQNNDGDGTSTSPRYANTWLQLTIGLKIP